ncbi:hypothetical protein COV17_01790 [Candidatus Woesearchaeota archaeon CG10_big_fil_rev_8_21_14_0_10_36_11]|nr:MAG: hypothetical protein COV17_01790 [Candidatus Woesearchaeota archaeon CG10_big_fil_rev_8_21_14_0_10_36_11]
MDILQIDMLEQRLQKLIEDLAEPHKSGKCYHLLREYITIVRKLPTERREYYLHRSTEINF